MREHVETALRNLAARRKGWEARFEQHVRWIAEEQGKSCTWVARTLFREHENQEYYDDLIVPERVFEVAKGTS